MEDWERILREDLAETDVIDIHKDKDPLLEPPTPRNADFWASTAANEKAPMRVRCAVLLLAIFAGLGSIYALESAGRWYGKHNPPAQAATSYNLCTPAVPTGTALFDLLDTSPHLTDPTTPPHFTKHDPEWCDPEGVVRFMLDTPQNANADRDYLQALGNQTYLPVM